MLLLHGPGASHSSWARVATRLGDHRVIIPDLLGFGESPKPHGEYDLDAHCSALAATVERHRPVVVAGHSMGAVVALALLQRHGNVIHSGVLVSPAVFRSRRHAAETMSDAPVLRRAFVRSPRLAHALCTMVCSIRRSLVTRGRTSTSAGESRRGEPEAGSARALIRDQTRTGRAPVEPSAATLGAASGRSPITLLFGRRPGAGLSAARRHPMPGRCSRPARVAHRRRRQSAGSLDQHRASSSPTASAHWGVSGPWWCSSLVKGCAMSLPSNAMRILTWHLPPGTRLATTTAKAPGRCGSILTLSTRTPIMGGVCLPRSGVAERPFRFVGEPGRLPHAVLALPCM